MTAVDLHQHLSPEPFLAALRARSAPPFLDGDALVVVEGRFPAPRETYDVEARVRLLDRDGVDVAVLSLSPGLGLAELPAAEREHLELAWMDGVRAIERETGGRFRALAPGRAADGFAGASVAGTELLDVDALAPLLDALVERGELLFVHPGAVAAPAGAPAWWAPTVQYTAEMQAAYYAWLAHGVARWPELRVVFAILAGGAPFQLERRALRGIDVRSTLHPNLYLDVATYGRRAIELCIETYGVHRLVYGSDRPIVDAAPTLHAVRGFGDSVAQVLQSDNPGSLLP